VAALWNGEKPMSKSPSLHFHGNDFIHPADQAAREELEAIPGFTTALKTFLRTFHEQQFHGVNMATKVRLGPRQLPHLYRLLPPLCRQLGIDEPEFYLEMNPVPNAYTYGDTRIFITVTSGMLQLLDENELSTVLAHECGHIVCRHVLYHTMANVLMHGSGLLGSLMSILSKPIQLGLLYWYRRGEFSADRAAAAVMRNPEAVVTTMIRLAGGPKHLTEHVNVAEYLEQARAYDSLQDSSWDKILQGLAIMNSTHPFCSVRAREVRHWGQSDAYRRLMRAAEKIPAVSQCPRCGKPTPPVWKFCADCGQPANGK